MTADELQATIDEYVQTALTRLENREAEGMLDSLSNMTGKPIFIHAGG